MSEEDAHKAQDAIKRIFCQSNIVKYYESFMNMNDILIHALHKTLYVIENKSITQKKICFFNFSFDLDFFSLSIDIQI